MKSPNAPQSRTTNPQRRRWQLVVGTAIPLVLLTGALWAQPDANNAGKANNPNNLQFGGGPFGMTFTAEQRAQIQQITEGREAQSREDSTRLTLIMGGFTDKAIQDAVVAFVNERYDRVTPLKEQIQKVRQTLSLQGATDAQVLKALNDLRDAGDTEQTAREAAEKALDAKIAYSKKPKLEAILTVMGIIGEASSLSTSSIGGEPMGGPGMMGGGPMMMGGGPGGPGMGGPGMGGPGGVMGPPPGGEMGPPPGGPGGFGM